MGRIHSIKNLLKFSSMKNMSLITILILIGITFSEVFPRPAVVTGLIAFRHNKRPWGVKFLDNGRWTYNLPYNDSVFVARIMGQIQDAGVDAVYVDLTNWQSAVMDEHGGNYWSSSADELPLISAEAKRRGMKFYVMMRAQHTNTGSGRNYYTSIARANWQAQQVWNEYAQENQYFTLYGKPVIKFFKPMHDEFWEAYNAAPSSEKTYLSRFTLITEETGNNWVGNTSANGRNITDGKHKLATTPAMEVDKYRQVYPYYQDEVGGWAENRKKNTAADWEEKVKWAMGASTIADLGFYDGMDGSAWAITDPTDAMNGVGSKTGRPCNHWPGTDWWAYYNAVKEHATITTSLASLPKQNTKPFLQIANSVLHVNNSLPQTTLKVLNLRGQMMLSVPLSSDGVQKIVLPGRLSAGMHLVKLSWDGGEVVSSVVLRK